MGFLPASNIIAKRREIKERTLDWRPRTWRSNRRTGFPTTRASTMGLSRVPFEQHTLQRVRETVSSCTLRVKPFVEEMVALGDHCGHVVAQVSRLIRVYVLFLCSPKC